LLGNRNDTSCGGVAYRGRVGGTDKGSYVGSKNKKKPKKQQKKIQQKMRRGARAPRLIFC